MSETSSVVPFTGTAQSRISVPIATGGSGPHDPGMQARVANLEAAIIRIEPLIVRIDERTSHLATKAELEGGLGGLRADLATKATKGTVWTAGFALAAVVVGALAAGGIYMPYLATLFRKASGG